MVLAARGGTVGRDVVEVGGGELIGALAGKRESTARGGCSCWQ